MRCPEDPLAPADMDECPGRETLRLFGLGLLPPEAHDAVAAHVLDCPRCAAALGDLPWDDEGLLADVRSSMRRPTWTDEPACARLADAARALAPEASTPTPSGATPGEGGARGGESLPRMAGPYLLIEELGHGGMGVVYRARHLPLDREVAFKMILAGAYASLAAITRFHTEGRAIARLEHPNVVKIYDFGEHEGQPYYTMEYVTGGSLAKRLAGAGPLAPRDAAALVKKLADAAESAHGKGVLHRDLKPANVLLTPDGEPKVSDFGL